PRSTGLLVTSFSGTRLRMELDRDASVLLGAARDGVSLLTWEQDSFAFADNFDETAGRYRGLRGGQDIALADADAPGLLVKPVVARRQLEAEKVKTPDGGRPPDTG